MSVVSPDKTGVWQSVSTGQIGRHAIFSTHYLYDQIYKCLCVYQCTHQWKFDVKYAITTTTTIVMSKASGYKRVGYHAICGIIKLRYNQIRLDVTDTSKWREIPYRFWCIVRDKRPRWIIKNDCQAQISSPHALHVLYDLHFRMKSFVFWL